MTRFLFITQHVFFIALAAYFAIGLERDPTRIPSVLIDKPLPEFDLPALEGFENGFSSRDLSGRVALINIFGSWCASCIIEHPVLMKMAAEGDVLIAGIDWKDPPGAGSKWLADNGNPYDLIGADFAGKTAIDLGVTGAPETFVIDKNGRIRHKVTGPIDERLWREELKPLIRMLEEEDVN